MTWSSCSFVLGNISLLKNSFNSCHMFSIGLLSGDSRGVCHQFIPFPLIKVAASIEVCFGSLSCMNLCPSGYKWQQCCFQDLDEQWSIHYAINNTNSGSSSPTYPCPHIYLCGMLCLGFFLRWLSNLSAAISLVRLHLNGAFICPDHVLKIIRSIGCSPCRRLILLLSLISW